MSQFVNIPVVENLETTALRFGCCAVNNQHHRGLMLRFKDYDLDQARYRDWKERCQEETSKGIEPDPSPALKT